MAITITSADLSVGGAVVESGAGVKYAIFVDSNVLVVYLDIDGTPALGDSDTAAVVHGGGNIAWCHAALDSANDIHIICECDSEQARDISYAIYDTATDTIGAWEEAADYTDAAPTNPGCSISLDSNDAPHVLYVDKVTFHGSDFDQIYYTEKTGINWAAPEQVNTTVDSNRKWADISVDSADDIHALFGAITGSSIIYRKNTAGVWGIIDFGGALAADGIALAVNETTPRIVGVDTDGDIFEGDDVDTLADTGFNQKDVPDGILLQDISLVGGTRYIFYIDTGDDVHLISNDGDGWADEGDLQIGTYIRVISEWAFNNENQVDEINYIFDDGSDVFYDSFLLAVRIPRHPAAYFDGPTIF